MKSKADFISYLNKHKQYYLPDEAVFNKDFLKEVLAGKKRLLRKAEVRSIQVPHYDELSVRRLWPDLKKDDEFASYFPSTYPSDKGPPRDYFFNILNNVGYFVVGSFNPRGHVTQPVHASTFRCGMVGSLGWLS